MQKGTFGFAAALLCGISSIAAAQSPAGPIADGAQPAAPQPSSDADDSGIADIVVTAQRREESAQRVAVAISAVSGDTLVKSGISDIANLSRAVPALVIQPGGGGANVYLRGVGNQQTNSFGENAVAFNFNGVYLARPTAPFGSLYDLERVEVVKGPQGTLYGRNATGGAVNILPRRPILGEFGGELNAEYGNFDTKRVNGAINIALGDQAALRVAGQVVDRDGYLSDGYNDEVGQALRVSLLVEPTPGWSFELVGDYFHQGGKGQGGVLAPSAYVPQAPALSERVGGSDPRSVAALLAFGDTRPPFGALLRNGSVIIPADDGFYDSHFWGVTGIIEGDLGFATLTIQPAYRRSVPDYLFYFTGFRGRIQETDDQGSLEVRLASNGDNALRYVLGAYYFEETQDAENFFNQGRLSTTRFNPQLTTKSRAVFGQLTYAVNDAFRLVGGARYTDEDRTLRTQLAAGNPANPSPPFGPVFTGAQGSSKVTWKAGVEFDAGARSLLYANASTGFKSGGFFVGASPNNSFAPEELTAYAVGTKNSFFGNRLRLNAEAFYWDYRDQQISFVGGIDVGTNLIAVGGKTVNAGKSRIYGVEAEVVWQPTRAGTFNATVQYLNARYQQFTYTALSASGAPIRTGCTVIGNRLANPGTADTARLFDIDCAGKPVLNSPKWSAQIGYQHRFELGDFGLVPQISTRLEASRETTIDYLPESRQGAYRMSDASLTLSGPDDGWSLTGYINNVEDRTILAGGFVKAVIQTYYATLRPPRTYGVRGTIKF